MAATRWAIPLQIAVIDIGDHDEGKKRPLVVLINPEVLSQEGTVVAEEGCLSVPISPRKRAARIKGLGAKDGAGKPFELERDGSAAKALQHDISTTS